MRMRFGFVLWLGCIGSEGVGGRMRLGKGRTWVVGVGGRGGRLHVIDINIWMQAGMLVVSFGGTYACMERRKGTMDAPTMSIACPECLEQSAPVVSM